MTALFSIVLIGLIAHLWSRLNQLRLRVDELERLGPALDHDDRPAPAVAVQTPIPNASVERSESERPERRSFAKSLADKSVVFLGPKPDKPVKPAGEEERTRSFSFEDVFGRRLPIWAGGITLAIAGMLIVKYSIDAGLVSPIVRVVSGLIFGFALIGGAEAALRADARVRDPRVRQALAGAGVASLYGAILIAANVYGLIGPVVAFLGMAATTALAMGLSLRFGAPSALLGLAGGLAAPALVGSGEPNIPLLASYLALAVGGLSILSRSQRWMWLGVAALTGGFGWAGILLLGGTLDPFASISLGLYIVLLGIVIPVVSFSGRLGNLVRIAGSIAAAAQMAGLVATGGFTLLHWGLFGLISAAIVWLSRREEGLARLPAIGLAIALLLLAAWPSPTPMSLALVMIVGAVIYGAPALFTLWRPAGSRLEAVELAAIGLSGLVLPMMHFFRFDGSNDVVLAFVALGSATIPIAAAALGWTCADRRHDARFAILSISAAILFAAAAALALPSWTIAPIVGMLGLGLLLLGNRAGDLRLEWGAWSFASAAMIMLPVGLAADAEWLRLSGEVEPTNVAIALLRWGGLAAIFGMLAWRAKSGAGRSIAQVVAALLTYGALAQVLGRDALAIACGLGLVGLALWSWRFARNALLPAFCATGFVGLLWAAGPLLQWSAQGAASLFGMPMLANHLPTVPDTLLLLTAPAVLFIGAWWMTASHMSGKVRTTLMAAAAAMMSVAAHVLFKQIFSIDSVAKFVRSGLAERTLWEALLFGAALVAWRLERAKVALGFTIAGLAHFTCYTVLLHNPLIAEQAVGSWPVFNLLLPAYALPLVWLWALDRWQGALEPITDRIRSVAPMLIILLFAFSSLRQVFHGSLLTEPGVTEWEDIFRSIAAIVLAIGFLLWGIRRGLRDWRIASLALMIGAVAKVFLFDASGLDGLLRIASFIALGLSLIGIGWLYSRYLDEDRAPAIAI